MSYREELHSKACLGHRIITAAQGWIDASDVTDHEFRLHVQDNGLLDEADAMADPEQYGIVDVFTMCKCEVKFQAAFELGAWFLMGEEKLAEYKAKRAAQADEDARAEHLEEAYDDITLANEAHIQEF